MIRFATFCCRTFDNGSCRPARKPRFGSGGLGSEKTQQQPPNRQHLERASCSQDTSTWVLFPILLLDPVLQMQVKMILVLRVWQRKRTRISEFANADANTSQTRVGGTVRALRKGREVGDLRTSDLPVGGSYKLAYTPTCRCHTPK